MSIEKIIQESVNKNPLAMKEALEEELRSRVALALEAKMSESDDEDEDDEDEDEDDKDDKDDEDMDESSDQLDELDKKTLSSYVKKAGGAGKEGLAHAVKSQMSAADSGDRAGYKKSQRQANNRSTGIQRAADRLAK